MNNDFTNLQDFLRTKAELQARLNLIPYDGTVEIKQVGDRKYLYIRKRILGKMTSSYVGMYSEELHQVLLKGVKDAKDLKKRIRQIEKQLLALGYSQQAIPGGLVLNADFARANMKTIIYDQAVLEGVATTFPDTELIIDNGKVNGVSAEDVQKILNLKHAWEFILDTDVLTAPSSYYVCQYVARLVNEGFYQEGGRIRGVPVKIGGTSYVPPIPTEADVKEDIESIIKNSKDVVDTAIELALYVMKKQIFNDGNKRTAIIFANHYLISNQGGLLVVPESSVNEFKKLLVQYYEGINEASIKQFLKEKCLRKM